MFLTPRQRTTTPRDPTNFPLVQLLLLSCVRVAEPIALTSILPYAWKLVLHFHIGNRENASFFAGLLVSAFSLAESLSGMYWGSLSDRIGRKPVLLYGCAGTMLSLLIVGFSTNFWVALFGRALGGLLNGNIGVVQTMVGELVHLPEHEPRAYSFMPFVWAIGTIVGPAIGGYFADPSENFPSIFSPHGIFARFPYLLPNLICALLLFIAIILGALLIDETHPDMQEWSLIADYDTATAQTPLIPAAGATEHAPADLRNESYGTFNVVTTRQEEHWVVDSDRRLLSSPTSSQPKAFSRRVVMLIIALGIFTYHSMTYDHLLPIFLQDDRKGELTTMSTADAMSGGLGMSIQQVGLVCSVNGVIALTIQALIFPLMARCLGIWKLFICVTVGHPLAYLIVPYLTLVPITSLYPAIFACLTVRNLFSIIAYPVLLILIKESSAKPSYLGRINGLAASIGAAARCLASPIAGFLYGKGIALDFTPLAWWASAGVALVGAIQIFFINRRKDKRIQIDMPIPGHFMSEEMKGDHSVVHIFVTCVEDVAADDTTPLV